MDEKPLKNNLISLNLGNREGVLTTQVYNPSVFILFGIGLTSLIVRVYMANVSEPITIAFVPS
jgi:hypothetical protein